jgi:hypothetical protein
MQHRRHCTDIAEAHAAIAQVASVADLDGLDDRH